MPGFDAAKDESGMFVARMKEEEGGLCLLSSPWPEASRFSAEVIREHFARNSTRPDRVRFVFNSVDPSERAKLEEAICRILGDPLGGDPVLCPPDFTPEVLARLKVSVSTLVQTVAVDLSLRKVREKPPEDVPYASLAPESTPPTAVGVEVSLGFFPLLLLLHFQTPTVEIDQRPYRLPWGTHYLHLPPGLHHVRVYFRTLFMDAGSAEARILVDPQRPPRLGYYFRWPWIFAKGEIRVEQA